jgi:hypothetical protein
VARYRRALLITVLMAVGALISAACGQKAGIHLASGGGGTGSGTDLTGSGGTDLTGANGTGPGGTANGTGPGGTGPAGTSGAGGGAGGSGTSGVVGGTGPGGGGGGTGGGGGADATGVTGDTVVIGVHGPASGAGAPSTSFYKYKQAYFDFIGATINGRRVQVQFADDGYNPSQAVAACKTLVQDKHAFLLVGAAGTDQIVECAKYAATAHVPYLAEGVTEAALQGNQYYFGETMSYKAQGPLLAQYIKNVAKKTKWGMIRGNTANFEDAHTGFVDAANSLGLTKYFDDSVPKDADNSTMQVEAQKFCGTPDTTPDHSDVALYPLMAPKLFIAFANFAASQNCFPRYAGIGITLGINVVAQAVCPSGAYKSGATFFSPFTGLDQADPDFGKATGNSPDADDIAYGIWSSEKLFAAELRAAGRNLTRQGFMSTLLTTKFFSVDTYPAVDFGKGHFGGTATNVLQADCSQNKYVTVARNKTSF